MGKALQATTPIYDTIRCGNLNLYSKSPIQRYFDDIPGDPNELLPPSALSIAILNKHIDIATIIIENASKFRKPLKINEKSTLGSTIFLHAILMHDARLMQSLVKNADHFDPPLNVNNISSSNRLTDYDTAVEIFSGAGAHDVVKLLRERKESFKPPPLKPDQVAKRVEQHVYEMAAKGDNNTTKWLKAIPDAVSPRSIFFRENPNALDETTGKHLLHLAIKSGNTGLAKNLMDNHNEYGLDLATAYQNGDNICTWVHETKNIILANFLISQSKSVEPPLDELPGFHNIIDLRREWLEGQRAKSSVVLKPERVAQVKENLEKYFDKRPSPELIYQFIRPPPTPSPPTAPSSQVIETADTVETADTETSSTSNKDVPKDEKLNVTQYQPTSKQEPEKQQEATDSNKLMYWGLGLCAVIALVPFAIFIAIYYFCGDILKSSRESKVKQPIFPQQESQGSTLTEPM